MRQYGDYLVQTDPIPEAEIERLFAEHLAQMSRPVRQRLGEILYEFNRPYQVTDPDTGKKVECFISSWRAYG